jgi:hypothetical protein
MEPSGSPLPALSAEEMLKIRSIPLNFSYNFAQPPKPVIQWTLLDLIEHSRFPMAQLDAADKWAIENFSMENFSRLIDSESISEPGSISARTVAKLVSYALQIVESTAESMESLGGVSTFNGDDLFAQLERLSDELPLDDGLSPWRHFWIATKHPTVRWAVNNAVMNRWGAQGFTKATETQDILP